MVKNHAQPVPVPLQEVPEPQLVKRRLRVAGMG
jgi:hypothetical protein